MSSNLKQNYRIQYYLFSHRSFTAGGMANLENIIFEGTISTEKRAHIFKKSVTESTRQNWKKEKMFTISSDLTCSGTVSGLGSGIPQISKEIFSIFPQEKCSQHDCSGCSNLGQASFRARLASRIISWLASALIKRFFRTLLSFTMKK
jgi:hypothetical protein